MPFRWTITRREQLGSLIDGPVPETYPEFLDDVRACAVRLVALTGEARYVFVGRSPESLHDYLAGVLAATPWRDRLALLNISLRMATAEELAATYREETAAMRAHLRHLGLDPARIAASPWPVALLDLVASGGTFGELQAFLTLWAGEEGVDPQAVRRRLRFVGITEQRQTSPKTWRWYQHVDWAAGYRPRALKSVSVPWRLWSYLGDYQPKTSRWNPAFVWADDAMDQPPREAEHLEALRLASHLYERGTQPDERAQFATALAAQPTTLKDDALRRLVREVRGG